MSQQKSPLIVKSGLKCSSLEPTSYNLSHLHLVILHRRSFVAFDKTIVDEVDEGFIVTLFIDLRQYVSVSILILFLNLDGDAD